MKKGFTLFELLVSISIIAILVSVASASYGSVQKKARDSRRKQDINAIQKAMEQYYAKYNGSYPTSYDGLTSTGEFLQVWPVDPKSGAVPTPYYRNVFNSTTYCICAGMEDTTAGNSTTNSDIATCAAATTGPYYCVKNQQ